MKSTSSWEISSYQMSVFVFLATQAITGLVEPLLALILSLESLVKFFFSIPFFKASSGVILGLLRIGLAVQNKERICSSSFQMQRQMETGAFSFSSVKKKKKRIEQKLRGTNDCSKPQQFSVPVTRGNIGTGPTYNNSGKCDGTNKIRGNYYCI